MELICLLFLVTLLTGSVISDEQSRPFHVRRSANNVTGLNSNPANGDSLETLQQLLYEGMDEFSLSDDKNVVLILGNSDCDKRALSLFLSGAEMKPVEKVADEDDDEDYDEDTSESTEPQSNVSHQIIETSQTIYPQLIYYDCPGMSSTRTVPNDVSSAFFMFKLLNAVNSMKILFTISHDSLKIGGDFKQFATQAMDYFKNIEQLQDGIGLVVTKVNTNYTEEDLINNELEIQQIAEFLNQTKHDLIAESPETNAKVITFIEILLESDRNTNQFNRIEIHREGNQNNRSAITDMVENTLQFIKKDDFGFNYPILEKSKLQTQNIFEEIQNVFEHKLSDIGNDVIQIYCQQEEHISDIEVMNDKMNVVYDKLSQIDDKHFDTFAKQLKNMMNNLQMFGSMEKIKNIKTIIEFGNFWQYSSNSNESITFDVSNGLANAKQYFFDSKEWYAFLINLNEKLSEIEVQQNVEVYDSAAVMDNVAITIAEMGKNGSKFLKEIPEIAEFLDRIDDKLYPNLENITVNSRKLQLFNILLVENMNQNSTTTCSPDKLTVKGYNIKMSEIPDCITRSIEIFAVHKVFVDIEFKKSPMLRQLSIIAPKWAIIGNASIALDTAPSDSADFFGVAIEFQNDQHAKDDGNGAASKNRNKS